MLLTPIESHGPVLVKRDDLFEIAGVRGGKVRTCWALAQGAPGLVTAGSRSSPQANIVAHIAQHLGVPCRVHTPTGKLSPELIDAQSCGAEIVQHKAGYNTVIVARARTDAAQRGWYEIPFGMECAEAVRQTSTQVVNLPDVARIVAPVGSGMSLCGIATGLIDRYGYEAWVSGAAGPAVLGVQVGADPADRLLAFLPMGAQARVNLVKFDGDYAKPHTPGGAVADWLAGVPLDPYYEGKAATFLRPGDLFWVVGVRRTAVVTL